jgi:hypothetical protein
MTTARFNRILPLGISMIWLVAAPPVAADCQPAGSIQEALPAARIAFVGTVAAVEGPVASFAVREVWAGEVPNTVEVRGLADDVGVDAGFGAGFSEDDRQWTEGETYLVVPFLDGAVLRDSICTATTEWSPELEALRPADARIVAEEEAGGAPLPTELILVAAVVLVIGGASVLAFRRR